MINFKPREDCKYQHNYVQIFRDIYKQRLPKIETYRALILNDLFFIVYFVMEIQIANHPFVVAACKEVEEGPNDFTLDVWAREHFKSTIITIAETIQFVLKNPDLAVGIFSAVRPLAKKFLTSIKDIFERRKMLHVCFPDIVYAEPKKEALLWSLDEGLYLRRNTTRKEPSVSAWGLVEGMPTGAHFDRRVYDDVVVEDFAESIEVMEKVKKKFDSSQNLGTDGGTHRVVGTYYHHADPLCYVRDKRKVNSQQTKYLERKKPATDTGEANGSPVFLSQKRLDALKGDRTFNCQQLLNPTPEGDRNYDRNMLHPIAPMLIPKRLYNIMIIDQAGDNVEAKGDPWAIVLLGIGQASDDYGQSDIYIKDLVIDQMRQTESTEAIVQMYLKGGIVRRLGVEKVSLSTTEYHITTALKAFGRRLSLTNGNLILLSPKGRSKNGRVVSAMDWPLLNGKVHYSTDIPDRYIRKAKDELDGFPYCSYHFLDAMGYFPDMMDKVRRSPRYDFERKATELYYKPYKPVNSMTGY
jgi:hypothetical protein